MVSSRPHWLLGVCPLVALTAVAACSSSGQTKGSGFHSGTTGSTPTADGGENPSPLPVDNTQTTPNFVPDDAGTPTMMTTSDGGLPMHCDDAGHCACINIASLGTLGTWGGTTAALMNWLNTQSSATVAQYTTKPTLDAAFLSQYNVIIVQLLGDMGGPYWSFTPAEISALSDWVHAGGGLITMSGYQPNAGEVDPLNQLLSFTDVSYNKDDILFTCPNNQCNCWGGTVPVGPWQPGPIGQNITEIGAFHGRSINPGSATIDAFSTTTTPVSTADSGTGDSGTGTGDASTTTTVYAAHEDIGMGHLFAWCDEWVTYTSQWLTPTAGGGPACTGMSASQVFQVPQFWYNAISYASQAAQCSFTINNPMIVPR
jgi:hypothetical protein